MYLEMLFELATGEELFVAQCALPGLDVVVLVHVVRPSVPAGERVFSTDRLFPEYGAADPTLENNANPDSR